MGIEPRISMITLGVRDVQKSLAFYRDGLGWTAQSPQDNIAFFQLSNIIFSIFEWNELAKDATVGAEGSGFAGVTLAHNVRSDEEVDATLEAARRAGAEIVKPAQKVFWGGYSGYFRDPDGHLWEVAHNPFWKLDEAGHARLP